LRYDLIAIGELGYLPFGQPGGQLLFHLISKLHENTSLLITTNLAFADRPQVRRRRRILMLIVAGPYSARLDAAKGSRRLPIPTESAKVRKLLATPPAPRQRRTFSSPMIPPSVKAGLRACEIAILDGSGSSGQRVRRDARNADRFSRKSQPDVATRTNDRRKTFDAACCFLDPIRG
jgi:hypothetical protein